MILNIQDDAPPRDREIYIVVVKKAYIHKLCGDVTIWNPINEDFAIGYILPNDEVVQMMHSRRSIMP